MHREEGWTGMMLSLASVIVDYFIQVTDSALADSKLSWQYNKLRIPDSMPKSISQLLTIPDPLTLEPCTRNVIEIGRAHV